MTDREDEEKRLRLGLGDLPHGEPGSGREHWSKEPDPLSSEAIDQFAVQVLRPGVPGDFNTLQADQDAIQVGVDVKSVFDVRPLNGFDAVIGGVINLVATVSCAPITAIPSPITFSFGTFGIDTLLTQGGFALSGCTQGSYDCDFDAASDNIFFRCFDPAATGLWNFYLFDQAGVLNQSSLGVVMPPAGSPAPDIFDVQSPPGPSILGIWTFVVTGFNSAANAPSASFQIFAEGG